MSEEGGALMPTTRKRAARQYPQSEGSAALADESLGLPQQPKAKPLSSVLGVAQGMTEEYPAVGPCFPARIIIAVVGLSLMLWCLIVLVLYWIRLRL